MLWESHLKNLRKFHKKGKTRTQVSKKAPWGWMMKRVKVAVSRLSRAGLWAPASSRTALASQVRRPARRGQGLTPGCRPSQHPLSGSAGCWFSSRNLPPQSAGGSEGTAPGGLQPGGTLARPALGGARNRTLGAPCPNTVCADTGSARAPALLLGLGSRPCRAEVPA